MSTQSLVIHPIEVYTSNAAWRGDLTLPSHRRIPDYLNDALHNFFALGNVTLLGWEGGTLVEKGTFVSTFVQRQTIIALIRNVDPAPASDGMMRIEKVPHRIMVYAPPFTLEGNYHVIKGADLYESLDSSRLEFFVLTSGMISLDRTPLLIAPAELVVVNRRYTTGFRIMG